MVAHFCKSGVIRPGTFLSDICYTLQKLQRTLTHLFFPLSSIYTPFPEDSCMQIKISLFFLHSLKVPKVIPLFGVFAETASFLWHRQILLLRCILFAWSQSGCAGLNQGWCVVGCPMVWQRYWEVLNLPKSQHTKQKVEETGEQSPMDISSYPCLLVCTELRRSQPELASSASHNDYPWTFMSTSVLNK